MKESLKRLGIKRWSAIALLTVYAVVPLTFLKGNPTGAIWTHDHASRYIRVNSIDLDNHKVASFNINQSIRLESAVANRIQDRRTQLMLLEFRLESIRNGLDSPAEKADKAHVIERRIDRIFDGLDKDGIREQDLRSTTDRLMVAEHLP